jgi:ArsR family transcriptional regulator, lead/cadmium/zinc/bismuth-responsive transcriptional repressor
MSSSDACNLLCLDLEKAEALRHAAPSDAALAGAALVAKALADPTRLRVAIALRDGDELCVCDLSWIAERSDKLVSHHVRQLRSAGLVESRRDGKMVMYSLTTAGAALLEAVASPQRVGS